MSQQSPLRRRVACRPTAQQPGHLVLLVAGCALVLCALVLATWSDEVLGLLTSWLG